MYNLTTKQLEYKLEDICTIFDGLDVSVPTRKEYKSRITLFLTYIQDTGLNTNSYLEFKRYLEKRDDYTVATKNKYLATAKVFLKEFNRRGVLPADITQNIRLFKQCKKHKKSGLTQNEICTLVQHIKSLATSPKTARIKALFSLLAIQGLRQIEVIRLDVEDISIQNSTAHIRGKGSDDKEIIYLAPMTVETIKNHIRVNRVGSGALFKSLGNRKTNRLSTMTIKREFMSIFSVLKIEKTVHGFRHFYITKLLQNMDVRDVRKFSRHRSLEMLIVYDDELDISEKSKEVFACFSGLSV